MSNFELTPDQQKALQDVGQVIAEEGAVVMSTLLDKKIDLNLKSVGAANAAALGGVFPDEIVVVECPFATGFEGAACYLFNKPLVAKLSDLMMMGDGTAEFNEDHIDAIQEGVNQMMGAAATALSTKLNHGMDFQPSGARLTPLGDSGLEIDNLTEIDFDLLVEGSSAGSIALLIPFPVVSEFAKMVGQGSAAGAGAEAPSGGEPEDLGLSLGSLESEMPSGGGGMPEQEEKVSYGRVPAIESMQLGQGERQRLELLLDVKLDVSIELGRSKMLLRDILELGPGAVIELDKMSGETVDLLINDKKLAEGEVVVVDENFGVRITHLISMEERIKMLQTS